MKFIKIISISICVIIALYFSILYIPEIFITKEGQKCLADTNCSRIKPICDDINESVYKNDLVHTEPMCLNYVCRCEWSGNLLHLK